MRLPPPPCLDFGVEDPLLVQCDPLLSLGDSVDDGQTGGNVQPIVVVEYPGTVTEPEQWHSSTPPGAPPSGAR